ncbi:glycosyltransferase [Ascidiimonas sp. W6]|uniref:glycosyltransferase n=1 Tax=Ascidiimonas meishanensis TaxID=3128903 RepID=UPI0030ED3B71
MKLYISLIIPVYNRPEEIDELLQSLSIQTTKRKFEVVIIEDGSTLKSDDIVNQYTSKLNISYFFKENSGPGDSRNYGMQIAKGNYFVILDSDCILPPQYIETVYTSLESNFVDCFGGPDAAHDSFTPLQKAINYAMTSFLTTGGIRGHKRAIDKFQPRSFNMGISKIAFEKTGGFGKIHPGEDPDLTIRIWNNGFNTRLIEDAFVYHKRRISWEKFYQQVHKFGLTRPILNVWHPETQKLTYWFPSFFVFTSFIAISLSFFGVILPLLLLITYFLVTFIDSLIKNKSLYVALLSVPAICVQFFGYGYGFIKSTWNVGVLKRKPEKAFPKLFFS